MEINKKMTQKRKLELMEEIKNGLLDTIREQVDEADIKLATPIIEEIAFIKVTLHTLKYDIHKNGATYQFKNGSQEMLIEHPSSKVYNSLLPKYNALFNSLIKILPEKVINQSDTDDKLKSFLMSDG